MISLPDVAWKGTTVSSLARWVVEALVSTLLLPLLRLLLLVLLLVLLLPRPIRAGPCSLIRKGEKSSVQGLSSTRPPLISARLL